MSLAFLLFGDQHALATYILQKLLALMGAADQRHSDLLRQYAGTNPADWRGHLVEALCIINARQALRKLGFSWQELRLHYLPQVLEVSLHVHPLLKALYNICEQLNIAQAGRLVLDINEQLARRQNGQQADDPLRFYDHAYLEIFLLDWLTRHHLRLGDINARGSDMQLLIEYFKFNDMHSLATLLVQTINSSHPGDNCETDASQSRTTNTEPPAVAPAAAPLAPVDGIVQQRRANALQVRKDNAGILLIINQQRFHRNVSEELRVSRPSIS